jgi:hypothetical protein
MPGFDRTRPLGAGSRTGGGRGRCFGGGSWRTGRSTIPVGASSAQDEAEILRNELAAAQQEITAMKSRLEELEKKG